MTELPPKPNRDELTERASRVRVLVFDVDGVLTDGGLYYGDGGEVMKRFDVKDGHGLVMARHAGLRTAILTARSSSIVETRGRELGVSLILQGRKDKTAGFRELLTQLSVAPEECAYMGDDVNDLGPLGLAGLSACPADAAPEVRQEVHYIARNRGGHGAARELVELCLRATGQWEATVQHMKAPEALQAVKL
ncbi:KdsC family phosphatase [Melittangium boletus]|uniref:3-deoxy-D-manno-octulosonate 8-phosphate phosphatase n=1 Tax=Melittangium boletus DSM 14713 TaxID=1294270 RepID=A0A250IGW8_9BACT|nr:HAD-IIIA family hydrolase [Melittangium boletus]ATB31074.1 3-deoxy-D-manno-octulosonate 8-phosphate phosphatase [Melittangium boletus DSM 14713]